MYLFNTVLYNDYSLLWHWTLMYVTYMENAYQCHRYVWTGPCVFFVFFFWTSIFFHINNILQLSMYHCKLQIVVYMKKKSMFQKKRGGGHLKKKKKKRKGEGHRVLSTRTCDQCYNISFLWIALFCHKGLCCLTPLPTIFQP